MNFNRRKPSLATASGDFALSHIGGKLGKGRTRPTTAWVVLCNTLTYFNLRIKGGVRFIDKFICRDRIRRRLYFLLQITYINDNNTVAE
jgi:hypothetical protein